MKQQSRRLGAECLVKRLHVFAILDEQQCHIIVSNQG